MNILEIKNKVSPIALRFSPSNLSLKFSRFKILRTEVVKLLSEPI